MQVLGSQTEMRSIDHQMHFAVDMGTIYCTVNSAVSVSPVARVSGHSIFLSRFPTLIHLMCDVRDGATARGRVHT